MGDTTRMNLDHKLDAPLDSLIHKKEEKQEACRNFLRGSCTRGASCPYSHKVGPKKEPCRDFARGDCPRGATCPYSHKVPREICRDYLLRDDCPRGSTCPYKHPRKRTADSSSSRDHRDSRDHHREPRDNSATQGSDVCRDYLRGECTRGVSCPYMHSDNVVPVCRDYVRGSCARGDTCPYHHLPNFKSTSAETCRDFQKGNCTRGALCPYAHIPAYVEICRDNQRGHCKRGLVCPFHHGVTVASPSSTKRGRDDDSDRGGRSSRYDNVDVGRLIEENKRLRARLAGH